MTRNIEKLKDALSLISNLRKFVILKFTSEVLNVISVNGGSVSSEPQVWCKIPISRLFETIEIQSMRDNTISMEINVDLLLQTLKNFDKANSEGLNIRLQRNETSGEPGAVAKSGRTASLALFYSNININSNIINHTFRIPVKILREAQDMLSEPTHSDMGLIMRLPNEFITMFKRLDKFRKTQNDTVLIQASKSKGLSFVLEEEGKFKVTISWNNKLEVHKPNNSDADSLRESLRTAEGLSDASQVNTDVYPDDIESNVKLKDWQSASKIVGRCKTVILYIAERECSLHCLLDETEDVELVYFINSVRIV
ncbi:MEC3 [Candida pseudojiufengensis]|uniref:MEC3 n=1 Tax=Candida pseudojiufengensis TaxID=497109 RepID=UPI0022248FC9|nr:MEC3 [Candida pseudojiufengensis]KAI5966406.1 MEC3 [Candida pseudojiufengensis]